MQTTETLVQAKNIVTTFPFDKNRRTKAVDGVSLELRRGEIVGLVGESGSGKSVTSMSMLQLILPPGKVEGEVYVNGIQGNTLDYGPNSDQARQVRGGFYEAAGLLSDAGISSQSFSAVRFMLLFPQPASASRTTAGINSLMGRIVNHVQ